MPGLDWVTVTRTAQTWVAAVAVAAAVLFGLTAHLQPRPDDVQDAPDPGTFRVLDRPQDADDRAAIESFAGDPGVDLSGARLLGIDPAGRRYLLVPAGSQLCLVVLTGPESAGGGCDPAANVRGHGIWLKGGEGAGDDAQQAYLAIVTPDEYADARLVAASDPVLRTENLVVIATRLDAGDRVTLHSDRYRDITITTRAG